MNKSQKNYQITKSYSINKSRKVMTKLLIQLNNFQKISIYEI